MRDTSPLALTPAMSVAMNVARRFGCVSRKNDATGNFTSPADVAKQDGDVVKARKDCIGIAARFMVAPWLLVRLVPST
jgi:hypothetical protein